MSRYTRDRIEAATLRAEGLHQLRSALFYDGEQSSLFTDTEVIALARTRYRDTTALRSAFNQAEWATLATEAEFHGALQLGLQRIELADLRD